MARLIRTDIFFVLGFIALTVWLAQYFGWINDDAQNYLQLAKHLKSGQGLSLRPSWGDTYWAVFPFGYPAIIATFMLAITDALLASKIANGFLFAGSIYIATSWLRLPLILTASLFFTIWPLQILTYTWSENGFIFATILSLAYGTRYAEEGHTRHLYLFIAGLLLLISTRYIGGFLLASYLLTLFAWRKQYPAIRLLKLGTAIVACAVAFAFYLYLNQSITGYTTGMIRTPAPETPFFLTSQFFLHCLCGTAIILPSLLLLGLPFKLKLDIPPAWSSIIVGSSYLGILYVLRLSSRFEQFSGRLLAPGIILIALGVMALIYHTSPRLKKPTHAIGILAISALLNLAYLYREPIVNPDIAFTQSRKDTMVQFKQRYGMLPESAVLISGGQLDPSIGWKMISPLLSSDTIFFAYIDGPETTLEQYRAYLSRMRYKGRKPVSYWFDFTDFSSIDKLQMVLRANRIDPQLAQWIEHNFQPLRLVECKDCHDRHYTH